MAEQSEDVVDTVGFEELNATDSADLINSGTLFVTQYGIIP